MNCWEKNAQEVEKALGTSIRKGLSEEEAKKRLEEYGENTLSHEGKKKGLIARFFAQLNDFMGTVFETICRQYLYLPQIYRRLPFPLRNAGRWRGNNPEKRRQKDAVQYRAAHSHLQLISFEEMAKISIA